MDNSPFLMLLEGIDQFGPLIEADAAAMGTGEVAMTVAEGQDT